MATALTVCKIIFDHETEEWIVRAYTHHNVRVPAADYFTDDKADAMRTAIAMLDHGKPAGSRVEVDAKKRLVWWTPLPEAAPTTPARPKVQIEIRTHPTSAAHKLVKVISRGRVYAATWAEPSPTVEEARQVWQEDRKAFRPYDESTGRYLGEGLTMATPTFTDVLRTAVAAMQTAHPERHTEIVGAFAAIVEGHVKPVDADNGKVLSRDGHTWYSTNGTCSCTAAAFGKPCRHLQAWKLFKHVQKQYEGMQAPAPAPAPPPAPDKRAIPAHFLQQIQGQPFIKYPGLLQMARDAGLQTLTATWTVNTDDLSLATAVATFADGRRFEECGDSTPESGKRVGLHWRRLSLTRAKARCLRDALGLDMCSVEEMD